MGHEYFNLQRKVNQYKEVLQNTIAYRQAWQDGLRDLIANTLTNIAEQVGLKGQIEKRTDLENLEAVVFSLGMIKSGMSQEVADNIRRDLIKHNGALVYQQLFNGKILVLINYPFIENYGQPQPPKTIAIYRPEELKEPYFLRHMETFVQDITMWEDYDDDAEEPNQRIGFKLNFGGTADAPPVSLNSKDEA